MNNDPVKPWLFQVKIRRPPSALRGSREGEGWVRAVFEQSEEVVVRQGE